MVDCFAKFAWKTTRTPPVNAQFTSAIHLKSKFVRPDHFRGKARVHEMSNFPTDKHFSPQFNRKPWKRFLPSGYRLPEVESISLANSFACLDAGTCCIGFNAPGCLELPASVEHAAPSGCKFLLNIDVRQPAGARPHGAHCL